MTTPTSVLNKFERPLLAGILPGPECLEEQKIDTRHDNRHLVLRRQWQRGICLITIAVSKTGVYIEPRMII